MDLSYHKKGNLGVTFRDSFVWNQQKIVAWTIFKLCNIKFLWKSYGFLNAKSIWYQKNLNHHLPVLKCAWSVFTSTIKRMVQNFIIDSAALTCTVTFPSCLQSGKGSPYLAKDIFVYVTSAELRPLHIRMKYLASSKVHYPLSLWGGYTDLDVFPLLKGEAIFFRSSESPRLRSTWPGFDTRTRRHMWVEFVVGSLLCSERFFSGYSGFPFSSKPTFSNSNSILECTGISNDRVLENSRCSVGKQITFFANYNYIYISRQTFIL